MEDIWKNVAPTKGALDQALETLRSDDFNTWYPAAAFLKKHALRVVDQIADLLTHSGYEQYRSHYTTVIEDLGPAAKPAAIALVALLLSGKASFEVPRIVASIGPAADDIIPQLLDAMRTASDDVKASIGEILEGIGTQANLVVPAIVSVLAGAGESRTALIAALGAYGSRAELAAPVLIKILENRKMPPSVRGAAAMALARIAADEGLSTLILNLLRKEIRRPSGKDRYTAFHGGFAEDLARALASFPGRIDADRLSDVLSEALREANLSDRYRSIDDFFRVPIQGLVALVEHTITDPGAAARYLTQLYAIGSARMVDHQARSDPLDALARLGEAGRDGLLSARGDSYAIHALGTPGVDNDYARSTLREFVRMSGPFYRGRADTPEDYETLAVIHALSKLSEPDIQLLEELAEGHELSDVRASARAALDQLKTTDSEAKPLHVRVFHPTEVPPQFWQDMRVIVHESELRFSVDAELRRLLARLPAARVRSAEITACEGVSLVITPEIPGFEFNPVSLTFTKSERVQEFCFRLRASPLATLDAAANGKVSMSCEGLLLAEVPMSIFVNAEITGGSGGGMFEASAPTFDTVFVSYAREDVEVVEHVETISRLIGTRFLRDTRDIESGAQWRKKISDMIDVADIFQLFWSTHSCKSENVASEWRLALSLKRNRFIRPCYWETPMPEPPQELAEINFAYVRLADRVSTHPAS